MKKRIVIKAAKAMAQGRMTPLCRKVNLQHVDEAMSINRFRKLLEKTKQ